MLCSILVTSLALLAPPFAHAVSLDVKTTDPSTVSIYAWPFSEDKPLPIAVVKLSSSGSTVAASLFKYSPPVLPSEEPTVRVGMLHPVTKKWTGTVVSRDLFASHVQRKFQLHIDPKTSSVYSVSLSSTAMPSPESDDTSKVDKKKKNKDKATRSKEAPNPGPPMVQVIEPQLSPGPVLNKPVVLNVDGKVDQPDTDNRTFLQKYWWAIALFLLVNLLAGGGEEAK